jgi:hypothetical protein
MPTGCKEGARARLLSCACRPSSAWLYTLPCTPALELKSGEVRTGLRHRLGLSMLPSNAPSVQCDLPVESYGRIGQPAMKLLHALGDEAAGPGGVT